MARFINVRTVPSRPVRPPQRFYPPSGQFLTLANVRGLWRPSGTVAGACVFAVVWTTRSGCDYWAPLHDFSPEDQRRLIDACWWQDRATCSPDAWTGGRAL